MFRRSLVTFAATATLVVGLAAPAVAHVTVNPREATQGGFAKLSFRVPNERDDSGTVKLEVNFPTDAPVAFVSTRPVAGWVAVVDRGTLPEAIEVHGEPVTEAVTKVTWTATEGTRIAPGQFEEFDVSVGPLPEADTMVFKALQTYESGEVVRWIEEATGDEEPEHPAPVLTLSASGDDHHDEASDADDDDGAEAASAGAGSDGDGDGDQTVAIIALVVGALGLLAGVAAMAAARRSAAGTASS